MVQEKRSPKGKLLVSLPTDAITMLRLLSMEREEDQSKILDDLIRKEVGDRKLVLSSAS